LDLGMTKSMMDKRGNIKLSVSDLFNTRVQRISSNYSNLNVHINQKNETRIVRLSFSYSFGNMKNRVQQRESRSEEKNRVAMP
ncbi:MAG TPA: outer membrane beta-barrel protein, partial [Sphingobacteriaceae bacterium]|nr:outer membrane beta-barrel protein [Sphingobacteriaceae bacterium]